MALLLVCGAGGWLLAASGEAAPSDAALEKALARPITLRLEKMSLWAALVSVSGASQFSLALDPSVPPATRVTLNVKDVSTRDALALLLQSAGGCTFEIWRSCVYVRSKTLPAPRPPAPELTAKAREVALSRRVWMLSATPSELIRSKLLLSGNVKTLSDHVEYLSDITAVGMSVAPEVGSLPARLRLRLRNLKLGEALDVLCRVTRTRIVSGADDDIVFRK